MREPIVPIEDLRTLEDAATYHPWRTFWRAARKIAKASGISVRVLIQESVAAGCLHAVAAHTATANADAANTNTDDATRLKTIEGAVDELVSDTAEITADVRQLEKSMERVAEQAGRIERLEALVAVLLTANPDASVLVRELKNTQADGSRSTHHAELATFGLVARDYGMPGEIDYKPSDLGEAAITAHKIITQH